MLITKDDIVIVDDYAVITVPRKDKVYKVALDIEDIKYILNKTVFISDIGYCVIYNTVIYRVLNDTNSKHTTLHILITGNKYCKYEGLVCDHINRNRLDNRKCNLRIITIKENNNNTDERGYYYDDISNIWVAYIHLRKKYITTYLSSESDAIIERKRLVKLAYPNRSKLTYRYKGDFKIKLQ